MLTTFIFFALTGLFLYICYKFVSRPYVIKENEMGVKCELVILFLISALLTAGCHLINFAAIRAEQLMDRFRCICS